MQPTTFDLDGVTQAATFVMSCDASIVVVGGAVEPGWAVERLQELERRWSRFVADSEVSRLNSARGRPMIVSDDTIRLVETMVEAWHLTEGAFDPTLLRPIVESGYQTSRTDPSRSTDVGVEIDMLGRPTDIRLDRAARVVQLPIGTALDPGGIGKGLAADMVVEEILAGGAEGALVEIGGDLALGGRSPDGDGWNVAVTECPDAESSPAMICLAAGGVATSTTRRRRWSANGVERHHMLDPITTECSTRSVRTSTVIAGSAALAEAFAKVAFSSSLVRTLEILDQHHLAGRFQLDNAEIRASAAWSRFAREAPDDVTESNRRRS